MSKKKHKRRYKLTAMGKVVVSLSCVVLILIIALIWFLFKPNNPTEIPSPTATPSASIAPNATDDSVATQQPITYDTTTPDSLTVIANKKHNLGDYAPSDLVDVSHSGSSGVQQMRQEAASALEELLSAANNDGVTLYSQSGYRSYQTQDGLYQNYANRDGVAAADKYSSRPGYSDHQTGLAMDIMGENTRMNASNRSDCPIEQCEGSPAALWLADNADTFGFILRYPQGKEEITGYVSEWWHYRYVGKELAPKIKESGLTLEEYFNVEGGDYNQ